MDQPKIILPPPTEADYLRGRADLIASMKPEGRDRAEKYYNNPDPKFQKALKWKS